MSVELEQQVERLTTDNTQLTAVLEDFVDLHFCDCCEGLFPTINTGDHNQCDTCTELANLSAEVSELRAAMKVILNAAYEARRCGDLEPPLRTIVLTSEKYVAPVSGSPAPPPNPDPKLLRYSFVDGFKWAARGMNYRQDDVDEGWERFAVEHKHLFDTDDSSHKPKFSDNYNDYGY